MCMNSWCQQWPSGPIVSTEPCNEEIQREVGWQFNAGFEGIV